MPDIDELIVSLEQSLKQSKTALEDSLKRQAEIQNQPDHSPEEIEQIETEVSAFTNLVKQNEQALENVLHLKSKEGGSSDFYIAAERQNGDS
jgi:predicted  nucleic acid-binding Zn-ribbon protein